MPGRFRSFRPQLGAKYPIFLPKNHHITHMLIYEVHVKNLHPGFLHTLSLVRDRYWVPQGIQIVRKVLHKWDVRCKRHHNSSYKLPLMPPVPRERLTFTGPFSNIGLDYAGPFEVKDQQHSNQNMGLLNQLQCDKSCLFGYRC